MIYFWSVYALEVLTLGQETVDAYALVHGQGAAGAEVVLHVNDE